MWSDINPACVTSKCFPLLGNVYSGHLDLPRPERLELAVKDRCSPSCATVASLRSRPRSERCKVSGLRTTPCGFLRFPHANPKPDRPLEPVNRSRKQKSRLQLRPVGTFPNDTATWSLGKAERMCKRLLSSSLPTATTPLYTNTNQLVKQKKAPRFLVEGQITIPTRRRK